jgi:hypothetical protein
LRSASGISSWSVGLEVIRESSLKAAGEKPQISPLRYPGFPVEFGGVGDPSCGFP